MSDLLAIFAISVALFGVILGVGAWRSRNGERPARWMSVPLAALVCVNAAAIVGLGWLGGLTIPYDGLDAEDLAVALAVSGLLLALTATALWLFRRGRTRLAFVPALCGALPTILVYALLLLYVSSPHDMR